MPDPRWLAIAPVTPPAPSYGAAAYAAGLHRGLAEAGVEVHVVTAREAQPPSATPGLRRVGFGHRRPFACDLGTTAALLDACWLTAAALEQARQAAPEVVLAHGWRAAHAAHAVCEVTGARLIAHLHESEGQRLGRTVGEIEAWLADLAEHVIVPSEAAALEASERWPEASLRVVAAGGGGDSDADLADFRELLARPDEALLLALGQLDQRSGLDLAVGAWRALASDEPCRLVVAGDGPLRAQLPPEVLATGHVSRSALEAMLAVADAVLLPRREAPGALALTDALAAGAPTIASDVGAHRAFAERCALVPVDQLQPLVEAVRQALQRERQPAPLRRPWRAAADELLEAVA